MSHAGEIERLSKCARPDVGIITCIGVSHIGNLGSQENICKAKLEICAGLPEGAPLVLNGDDPFLRKAVLPDHVRPVWFSLGDENADVCANITDEDRYFCYRVKKESNLFFTVKDESGKYMKFNVDGTQTEAICSGEVSGKGELYPITEGDILVSLPSGGDEKDDITEIQILVPAHTTKIFYIEEVLVTCANGSIPTQMIIR